MSIDNKKVFITGSTGFIGCRLAEILYLKKSTVPICLVHNFSNAARLARLPVKMIEGNILDYQFLREAMAGCQIVFHCAFGNTGNEQLDSQINEEGTRNVLSAAKENQVSRVVHISSVAVYGHRPPQEVDEETPTVYSGWSYGDSKLNAEKICQEYMAQGLEVVIARPTIVYGPFSPNWTISVIKRVQYGGWENVRGLDGWCSPVYIDDLITGLLLSAEVESAKGHTFIFSGDETLTWNDYFQSYNRLAGLPEIKVSSKPRIYMKTLLTLPLRMSLEVGRKYFEKTLFEIYQNMHKRYPILTQKVDSLFRGSIQPDEFHFFSQQSKFSTKKAKAVLGYKPKYSLQIGAEITGKWLKHHAYID
jgi:nucleoside-diphosphate-sugar epimerase